MSILLSGYLPAVEHQGVTAREQALIADDGLTLTVVGVLEQISITHSRIDPEQPPSLQLRWRHIEPVVGNDAQTVLTMLSRVRSDRVGAQELEGVAEVAAASAGRRGRRHLAPAGAEIPR